MMRTMKRCVAFLGLFALAGVATASAQTLLLFDVRTDRVSLTKTGRSEVLGNITLTADAVCGTSTDMKCVSQGGNIEVLYAGVKIDNSKATGITICENIHNVLTCIPPSASGTYLNGLVNVTNTSLGGLLTIGVNNAIDFAAGDQVLIEGVRGQIDKSFANTPFGATGAQIDAFLTPSPSTIASFFPSQGPVGFSFDGMTITTTAGNVLECIGKGGPNVQVHELYPSSFVDNGFGPHILHGSTLPSDPRVGIPAGNTFGATANTEVTINITGLPSGVTLTWPAASGTDANTGSQLFLVSQSASGDSATYVFETPDQVGSEGTNGSDQFVETWNIGSGGDTISEAGGGSCDADDICVTLSGTDTDFGSAAAQGQLAPPANTGLRPRYNDPPHPAPGLAFLTVGPCTTTLLFPWVANVAGFDTGIAIANTTQDFTNASVVPFLTVDNPTPPEHGTCALYGFPVGEGTPTVVTTKNVSTGDTLSFTLSGGSAAFGVGNQFNGFVGYLIARCNFQYAHGFAFFSALGAPNGAGAGYLALVIPDPVVTNNTDLGSGRFAVANSEEGENPEQEFTVPATGEQLAN